MAKGLLLLLTILFSVLAQTNGQLGSNRLSRFQPSPAPAGGYDGKGSRDDEGDDDNGKGDDDDDDDGDDGGKGKSQGHNTAAPTRCVFSPTASPVPTASPTEDIVVLGGAKLLKGRTSTNGRRNGKGKGSADNAVDPFCEEGIAVMTTPLPTFLIIYRVPTPVPNVLPPDNDLDRLVDHTITFFSTRAEENDNDEDDDHRRRYGRKLQSSKRALDEHDFNFLALDLSIVDYNVEGDLIFVTWDGSVDYATPDGDGLSSSDLYEAIFGSADYNAYVQEAVNTITGSVFEDVVEAFAMILSLDVPTSAPTEPSCVINTPFPIFLITYGVEKDSQDTTSAQGGRKLQRDEPPVDDLDDRATYSPSSDFSQLIRNSVEFFSEFAESNDNDDHRRYGRSLRQLLKSYSATVDGQKKSPAERALDEVELDYNFLELELDVISDTSDGDFVLVTWDGFVKYATPDCTELSSDELYEAIIASADFDDYVKEAVNTIEDSIFEFVVKANVTIVSDQTGQPISSPTSLPTSSPNTLPTSSPTSLPTSSSSLPFPFGTSQGDELRSGTGISVPITLVQPLLFYGVVYDVAYQNIYGHVSFGGRYTVRRPPRNLPDDAVPALVAPFWSDADNTVGSLFARSTRRASDVNRANAIVAQAGGVGFSGTATLVTTWEEMVPFDMDPLARNTFQSVLVYDSTSAWVIFSYARLDWFVPRAAVAINYGDDSNSGFVYAFLDEDADDEAGTLELAQLLSNTNCGIPGTYAFEIQQLGGPTPQPTPSDVEGAPTPQPTPSDVGETDAPTRQPTADAPLQQPSELPTFQGNPLLFPFGLSEGDLSTPPNDDGSSSAIPLVSPMNFYRFVFLQAFQNTNGHITFDIPYGESWPPLSEVPALVAPFWSNVDTRNGGDMFARSTNRTSDLDIANAIVASAEEQAAGGSSDDSDEDSDDNGFIATAAFVATWDRVAGFNDDDDVDEADEAIGRNTFQAALVYNSMSTWAIFSYEQLQWYYPEAAVGVNGDENDNLVIATFDNSDQVDGSMDLEQFLFGTNCGIPGTYAFELTSSTNNVTERSRDRPPGDGIGPDLPDPSKPFLGPPQVGLPGGSPRREREPRRDGP